MAPPKKRNSSSGTVTLLHFHVLFNWPILPEVTPRKAGFTKVLERRTVAYYLRESLRLDALPVTLPAVCQSTEWINQKQKGVKTRKRESNCS